ncbi:PH domain-containing protein [Novilysobacter spongiicola]|uniref:YdbS-like PH domain-containing protein n=1 Tax=Lysobacter spongiicola DSM 21749 TaxID=1122188 RepID=A0A1T4PPL2_9GAMM|nr:PH domain-containing protein [Lysobacter spongiicola]SJZ93483.1 hypothetical protein SAMN02745674_01319 [Lysobacter spongiicola DSM 21749]
MIPAAEPPVAGAETDDVAWQPLPPRSRLLFLIGLVPPPALGGAITGFFLASALDSRWTGAVAGLLLGGAFGLWLALKQYRHTTWRLDPQGLALRRGRLWQRETRVPMTRVQHLDIKRGPLQRRRGLSTLIVHTAGTRHSAVTVPHLDADDAERLRDTLGRQIDDDDDD